MSNEEKAPEQQPVLISLLFDVKSNYWHFKQNAMCEMEGEHIRKLNENMFHYRFPIATFAEPNPLYDVEQLFVDFLICQPRQGDSGKVMIIRTGHEPKMIAQASLKVEARETWVVNAIEKDLTDLYQLNTDLAGDEDGRIELPGIRCHR